MALYPHLFPSQFVHSAAASPAPGTVFPDWPAKAAPRPSQSYADAQKAFKIQFIRDALQEYNGNITRTARAIGMSRRNLQNKIQKLGIEVESARPRARGTYDE
jgi:DNA-binding NtrC family response regulator